MGCQSNPDNEDIRSEILELHRESIAAHLNKDVDFFVRDLSDNFISVSDGEINFPTKEEIKLQFSKYLNNTTFKEYIDLQKPIIGFSKDGSTAWSIVQVKVTGKRKMEDGKEHDMDFVCAWITMYKKEGDRWKRTIEVSNFKL